MSLRLSVLDQSTVGEGYTAADALHQSIDLAQAVEELGYHRYWLAEHHLAVAYPDSNVTADDAALLLAVTDGIAVARASEQTNRMNALRAAALIDAVLQMIAGRTQTRHGVTETPPGAGTSS